MNAICGPSSLISSDSTTLTSCLESRLRQRTRSLGSTLYTLTWKQRTTPSGRSISALRASVRRTSASDSSSAEVATWPTPSARDGKGGYVGGRIRDGKISTDTLDVAAQLSGWPTVTATDAIKGGQVSPRPGMMGLSETAPLAGWPTTRAADGEKNVRTVEGSLREIERKGSPQDLAMAGAIAGWPTPNASNVKGAIVDPVKILDRKDKGRQQNLQDIVFLTGPARLTASGQILTGSDAGMESGGQLDPSHSRWLMALPPVWDVCGVTAMESLRKSPSSSSRRTSTRKPPPLTAALLYALI